MGGGSGGGKGVDAPPSKKKLRFGKTICIKLLILPNCGLIIILIFFYPLLLLLLLLNFLLKKKIHQAPFV